MGYITPKEAAEKWGITPQRVTAMCRAGAIRGAWRDGKRWQIPDDADKPEERVGRPVASGPRGDDDSWLPLPIGLSSYARVEANYALVDKTLLIKEVIRNGAQATMFLRPRRFGKTLNMDMLRCFFEKSNEDTSAAFRDRLIWREGERYTREQGKYPTVWISLKDARGLSWEYAFAGIKDGVYREVARHSELFDSAALNNADKALLDAILRWDLPDTRWSRAFYELSSLLHKHHGQPVVLFIDEYDTPIQDGYLNGYYNEVIAFMRPFISSLVKDNPHLHMAFLSGVTRVAKESIFSGLNNLKVDSLLGGGYGPYFGFTYDETRRLLEQYGREDMFGQVIDWYDGYRIDGLELVNPWSVDNFIAEGFRPQGYWQQTGSSEIIRQIVEAADPDILKKLNTLIGGGQVVVDIDDGIAYPQVEGNPNVVFSFLLMAGYLRIDERLNPEEGGRLCRVSIPNKEIRQAYAREAIGGQPTVKSQTAAEQFRIGLVIGDAEMVEENLGLYLREVVSYHDTAGEAFYHGMVVGLCAAAEGRYRVSSNRESGLGRYDVQLAPRRPGDAGIVIEVKAAPDDAGDLQALADAAIGQILQKDYARELMAQGVEDILAVGLAFRGKDVAVATRTSRQGELPHLS